MITFSAKICRLIAIIATLSTTASPFFTTPYEPVSLPLAVPTMHDGSTSISIMGTELSGGKAYNGSEQSVPFLEQYGTIEAKNLITGLDTPEDTSVAYKYLHADGAKSIATNDATLRFNDADNKYSFSSTHLCLTQHLFTGLFAQIHAKLVTQSIAQTPSAAGTNAHDASIQSFLVDLDTILAEYDLPPLSSNKRESTLERFALMLGWSGHTHLQNSVFQELSGSMSAGYTVTPSSFNNPLAPAVLAHNMSDGFIARLTGNAQISNHIAAYVDLSSTIYNQRNGTLHVVTDDTEGSSWYAGPILLGTGFVKKDPGTLWNMHASIQLNRLRGFSLGIGYHFSFQEVTDLIVIDATLLRGADWTGSKLFQLPALQKKRLNSDPRLLGWKHHAAVFTASYQPTNKRSRILPHFTFSIAFPLLGHRSANPDAIVSGGGRIAAQWKL